MLDFLKVSTRTVKGGLVEVYPTFLVRRSQDLMIRGGDFYAIWDEELKLWSTDPYRAIELIDREIQKSYDDYIENMSSLDRVRALYLWDSTSLQIDKWNKYVQKQLPDFFVPLDEKIIFQNDETDRKSYASKRLPYALMKGKHEAWDRLMSVLYSEEERHKIEWIIGSIACGDSKHIQKFIVFYGAGGTGKSTVLNIISEMFEGYWTPFDAKSLGSSNNSFSLSQFNTNPLVAIDHDTDLSRIEDNSKLNSLVSHEKMTVNEKHKKLYSQAFSCMLLMGTNKPVKITDSRSGLIRRLIDVSPTGEKVEIDEYNQLISQIKFELGAIVEHCLKVYKKNSKFYNNYIPVSMLSTTNHMFDFVSEYYDELKNDISLASAWDFYKQYVENAYIPYPMNRLTFKEELKSYFENYDERYYLGNGKQTRSYYSGFIEDKFTYKRKWVESSKNQTWLSLDHYYPSTFDKELNQCPAQLATSDGKPKMKWSEVTKQLNAVDPKKLHYVKVPQNHIVIDFDLKDEDGNKNLDLNLKAAAGFMPTYAEVSQSGQALHLHYIYDGDVEKLANVYEPGIEIKIFTGGSSLRRKLSLNNSLPINVISSGLPLKEVKSSVLNDKVIKSERQLRNMILKNFNKEYCPGTKPSIDFIEKLLNEAYESGIIFDVTDMRPDVIAFAGQSTNHRDYCLKRVKYMKFKSEQDIEDENIEEYSDDAPIVIFDIEVFPNLFVICWKKLGSNKVHRMINPDVKDVRKLLKTRLVGFNNRRYDNHIIFAASEGYTVDELYRVSQSIINGNKDCFFGQAYNLSYTDIYDFASAGNKKGLKKFEIELGIHHQELGFDWTEPVPEDKWDLVAEYCENDVIATEAVWNHLQDDFRARELLVLLANKLCPEIVSTVNDTTNTLSTRIIFGKEKHPQNEFYYRNLSERVPYMDEDAANFINTYTNQKIGGFVAWDGQESMLPFFPGYEYDEKEGVSTYRGDIASEGGYVYSEPGIYDDVGLLDVESEHPSSVEDECLFGPKYTKRFSDIKASRIKIKHKDFDGIEGFLDGALVDIAEDIKVGKINSKALSDALKTVINSVYGLTKAGFDNPFKDLRNVDNIVAKRGALFMIDLKNYIQEQGYQVIHIKTDSVKIANVDDVIIQKVKDFGLRYGYKFELEALYSKICLIDKAQYIAQDMKTGEWTATGDKFKIPYVFKTLFSHEEVTNNDLIEVFNVKTALYLDFNEGLGEEEHSYHFVGRTGAFYPIQDGRGGAELRVKRGEKYNYPAGATGFKWLEAEVVEKADRFGDLDMTYWDKKVEDAKRAIEEYDDYDNFVGNYKFEVA